MANDKFYKRDGRIEWVYYNPNSDAGGQYVYNMLTPYVIREAGNTDVSNFFDLIGSHCVQYLIDVDTFGFKEAEFHFNTVPGDFEECTGETMEALIKFVNEQTNCGEITDLEDDEYGQ